MSQSQREICPGESVCEPRSFEDWIEEGKKSWRNYNTSQEEPDALLAINCFRQAIRLDENSVPAHHLLGSILLICERFEESFLSLEKALSLTPNDTKILSLMGYVRKCQGYITKSVGFYKRVKWLCRNTNKFPEACCQLGYALLEYGTAHSSLQAIREFKIVLELDNNDAAALAGMGRALHTLHMLRVMDDHESALEFLRKAVSLAPDVTYILMWLKRVQEDLESA